MAKTKHMKESKASAEDNAVLTSQNAQAKVTGKKGEYSAPIRARSASYPPLRTIPLNQ